MTDWISDMPVYDDSDSFVGRLTLYIESDSKQFQYGSPFWNMTVACVGKTPVSVLQELLSRRGTTPRYELVQIEGAIHEPTFRYRVTVADVVAMGTGRSKKEAKHAAAKALLDKMIVGPGDEGSIPVGNSNTMPEVETEERIKCTKNGGNAEFKIDIIDGANEMSMTAHCSSMENVLNSSSQVYKGSENLVMELADKECTLRSLIAKKVTQKKRKFEGVENDLIESLEVKKLELSIELMKKDCYLKSLEILKLERDLGILPSEFTCNILERRKEIQE